MNGVCFSLPRFFKINSSGLEKYFIEVINSETCGYLKPDKEVFEYAIKKINSSPKDCIMIGDELFTDILGAKNAGVDHIYFNFYSYPLRQLKHLYNLD